MKKIRIAQIGMSETTHAGQVFQTMRLHPEVFEIVGCADVDAHQKPIADCYRSVPNMSVEELLSLPALDAVAVECDEVLQTHYAVEAVKRGLPVHLEKPGSEPDDEFDALIDLAKEKNVVFHTGYMYRYNPYVQQAMEDIRAGKLGEIYSVEAQMDCYHPPRMREWFSTFRGGMMYYLGCHLVDLILQIQGEPLRVTPLNRAVEPERFPGCDFGMALFEYPHGVSFAKTCAVEPGGYMRRQLVICGTRGTVELKPFEAEAGAPMTITTGKTEWRLPEGATSMRWSDAGVQETTAPFNRYEAMMLSFAAMVRGEKQNPWSYDYERMLHKYVLEACGFTGTVRR